MGNKNVRIIIFLDTGLNRIFVPLLKLDDNAPPEIIPPSLRDALEGIEELSAIIPDNAKDALRKLCQDETCDWDSPYPFIKGRYGKKTWHFNKTSVSLGGAWILVETNTSGQDSNEGQTKYDRGCFAQQITLSNEDVNNAVEAFKNKIPIPGGPSPYIPLRVGETLNFHIQPGVESIDLNGLTFELTPRMPAGKVRDVDLILDIGNTSTLGVLFSNVGDSTIPPDYFRKCFRVLRLKPDPTSGESFDSNGAEAGIVPSWIVLHEQDHQKYLTKDEMPELIQTDRSNISVVSKTSGVPFIKKTRYEVSGSICRRIPQMFMQISPVILGDQAERCFNSPYAKSMVSMGARVEQYSPKRYYWDKSRELLCWNMLLNEWDKHYSPHPTYFLPTLQGEMLRFFNDDGSLPDLSKAPEFQPTACPARPEYPRQSTLTWFLLRILERACEQANSSCSGGMSFIPHRLRKVMITYPSGWTTDEVSRYRERCQDALDIFSEANLYHGLNSEFRLEMVPVENTPDDAFADQLPFVFSEIIRYPGQTAAEWISLVGKKRSGTNTVRIMSFDIGGGTTDISVIEYQDRNTAGMELRHNMISISRLFKDGLTVAGDDLIKTIIEQIVLKSLIRAAKNIPNATEKLVEAFTRAFPTPKDEIVRQRSVRTCLIPMAKMCLSNSEEESFSFSAQDAGVNLNSWNELLKLVDIPAQTIPYDKPFISFSKAEIDHLIEIHFAELFRNCAMYAVAYDIDMLIFSGKTSEIPFLKTLAGKYVPIADNRILFARDFKPGTWYPFTDPNGYIEDAKTVTVVGGALYYALSSGMIENWSITVKKDVAEPNEWGELSRMKGPYRPDAAFMPGDINSCEVDIRPDTILARRQNEYSSPKPVYKFIWSDAFYTDRNALLHVTFERHLTEDGETLSLTSVKDLQSGKDVTSCYELVLWPCEKEDCSRCLSWVEEGLFCNLGE